MTATLPTLVTFGVDLAGMVLIGFWAWRRTRDFDDFILGGRSPRYLATQRMPTRAEAASPAVTDMHQPYRLGRPGQQAAASPLRLRSLLVLGVLGLACSVGSSRASAAQPDPSSPGLPTSSGATNPTARVDEVLALRTETEARLAEARARLAAVAALGGTNLPAGVSLQDQGLKRALSQRLVNLLEQRLDSLGKWAETQTRTAAVEREAREWTRFPEPGPYSVPFADRLREELQTEQLEVARGMAWVNNRDLLFETHREALAQAEERIRQIDEQLETAGDPAVAALLGWQRSLEQLRRQVAAANLATLDLEGRIAEENLRGSRTRVALLQRQLVIAEAGATLTPADLEPVFSRLDGERLQVESELAAVQARRASATAALEAARTALELVSRRADSTDGANALATAAVAVREDQLRAAETGSQALRLLLEVGSLERTLWEQRLAGQQTNSVSKLRESALRLRSLAQRIDLWHDQAIRELEVSSSQLQVAEGQLNALPKDSELFELGNDRVAALREVNQFQLRLVGAVERLRRLSQRWQESLRAAQGRLPLLGRVQSLFVDSRSFLQNLWDFEFVAAEDTITVDGVKITGKRSVTLGKIIQAAFILVAGIWAIGLVTRFGEPIIARRFKIERYQAGLIRRWLRALLVGCWVLFSLASVKIPLTVFAFAGGALAIGLGFGMQTILKNLVSGMILLFERPFRVGDVLEVGGQKGTITSIGLRASVLHLWDGTETLIPNSSLLENNVSNWTYSNRKVRFSVTVGVAYGSDVRRVIELLDGVAESHGLVEKDPEPEVLFTSFGDSTLEFELRYWVDVGRVNAAQVSSDLRLMIAGAFAKAGVAIDYPQRDVHLHASVPIPVHMVSTEASRPGSEQV